MECALFWKELRQALTCFNYDTEVYFFEVFVFCTGHLLNIFSAMY